MARSCLSRFLTVGRIEFAVTYRCNSHCQHCQIEPDKRASQPVAIDQGLAVQIVQEVARAYSPGSLMTFGGEPLLFPDIVCAIHAAAMANGIPKRQVITNAGWPRSAAEFRTVASRLADSGVNDIHVSVDCFHQEYIPLAVVEQNVRLLLEAGIGQLKWNPCWLVSAEHDNLWNRRTRAILQALAHLPVAESAGNSVQPMGHALLWLRDFMPPRTPLPAGSCGDLPYTGRLDEVGGISVETDGSITVCDELVIGNAAQSNTVQMLRSYDPYRFPEMRALLEGGVAALAELARIKGVEPDPAGYYSVCDMCRSLRRQLPLSF
ncbi:MAG: radical SAM protein [Chloroflexi bacterium]|nr:radical SAM protein [Chloroflexota bacterium]